MNNEVVDNFNDEARELETRLDELGRMICNIPKSSKSWQHINRAIEEVRYAIYYSHLMYNE